MKPTSKKKNPTRAREKTIDSVAREIVIIGMIAATICTLMVVML